MCATHPADAKRIVGVQLFGEVCVGEDAGTSWRKLARELPHDLAGACVLNILGARYELPTARRARISDEEVSTRKRCSGISVKRST